METENTPEPIEPAPELTTAQAIALTKRIRRHVEDVWALLLEARDRGAWKRMDYPSFDAYARGEFDMTRGNAYRLIAQGEVILALEAAQAGETLPKVSRARDRSLTPLVSARQAVKIHTADLLPVIVEAIKGGAEPSQAVIDVLSRAAEPQRDVPQPPAAQPERESWWSNDPQVGLTEAWAAVAADIGPGKTAVLLRNLLKRTADLVPQSATMGEVNQATCPHPKASEDKKMYGTFCGVCGVRLR